VYVEVSGACIVSIVKVNVTQVEVESM
jgi:hypothetical protein